VGSHATPSYTVHFSGVRITCGLQLPDNLLSRKDEGGVFRPADEHLQAASTIRERSELGGECVCSDWFFCEQSAVAMRIGAWLTACKFTLLSRSGSTGGTRDSEYLF
jgi:hypothetical protein